jgi:SAM-dependent methyltransferase
LGETGRLISTDFAPEMVGVARRRAKELGISNADFKVLDAERNDLDADSVDGVLCRWGYMLMADLGAALAQTRRVLRHGGRLALSVWSSPAENPWASLVPQVLVGRGLMAAIDPQSPGGIFSLARPDRLQELLLGAGFVSRQIENLDCHGCFVDFDEYWAFLMELARAVSVFLVGLSAAQRDVVRGAIQEAAEPFRSNGGYDFPGRTVNVSAS